MWGSFRVGVWSIVLAGCVLAPIDLADRRCPCIEGWICDPVRDRCVPSDSIGDAGASDDPCNTNDDDGDGRVDEGPDACGTPARASVACEDGACVLTCASGYADCNGVTSDGCEASLADAATCGDCATRCEGATPLCIDDGAGGHRCSDQCDRTLCGASCVDVMVSVSHCGGCDQPCELRTGVLSACVEGTCAYACAMGRADCDADPLSCETDVSTIAACGSCANPCSTVRTTPDCVRGACVIVACEEGWASCDDDARDGCETSLRTNIDCGACGVRCEIPHAASSCETGSCVMGACEPGFADCTDAPGCETDLSDPRSCGACGVVCGAGTTCDAVGCVAPSDVAEVGAGDAFACARLGDGRVACWGADESGQLGNGSAGPSATAVLVAGITDAIDLGVGARHACVVRRSGTVMCWGDNDHRQLGATGPPTDRTSPVQTRDLADAVLVAAGRGHTCALRASGVVACWGDNDRGQLGRGSLGGDGSSPGTVSGLTQVVSLDAGAGHTCAVRRSGEIFCWGDNTHGQLGDGTTTQRLSPVAVLGVDVGRYVALGAAFTCAVATDGRVGCWGAGESGQLGDGTTFDRPFADVLAGLDARWVSAGDAHACAGLVDGSATCWGANASGQLGDGTRIGGAPRPVVPLSDVVAIEAGAAHTCAVRDDGTAKCWGRGADGRLGDGGTSDQLAPVEVVGFP